MIAHVVPIRGSARDTFSRCAAMLMLTPVTRPEAPSADLIRSLFDLTPAEARVARGLAAGQTVKGDRRGKRHIREYDPHSRQSRL